MVELRKQWRKKALCLSKAPEYGIRLNLLSLSCRLMQPVLIGIVLVPFDYALIVFTTSVVGVFWFKVVVLVIGRKDGLCRGMVMV